MVLYKKNKTESENKSDTNVAVLSNEDVCNVTIPKEIHANEDKNQADEKADTLTLDPNSADERLKQKVEELKSSDSKLDHMKAWLIESDTSKVDNLSDTLDKASKSKAFGIIAIVIAILLSFAFK